MTEEEVHRTDPSEGVDTPSAAPTKPKGREFRTSYEKTAYEKVDWEILLYLKYYGERTSRQICDHLSDELCEDEENGFPRSTLWGHLIRLYNARIIKQRLQRRGESTGKAYWSINPLGMVGNRGNSSELPEGAVSEEKKKRS